MRYLFLIAGTTFLVAALGVVPDSSADPVAGDTDPKAISAAEWGDPPTPEDRQTPPLRAKQAQAIRVTQAAEESPTLPSGGEDSADRKIEALPDLTDVNIFEHLKIELLDLEELGRRVDEKLTGETIRMSLAECVLMALDANQDILIVGYEPLRAATQLRAAKGEFDPTLSATARYSHSEVSFPATTRAFLGAGSFGIGGVSASTPQGLRVQTAAALGLALSRAGASTVQVDTGKTFQVGLAGRSHWGTQYSVTFDMDRQKGTFTGLLSEYSGGGTLSLTQPLLRGWGKNVNLITIRRARIGRETAASQFRTNVLNTLGDVVKAYWDLVRTIENLQVRQESFDNAKRLVEINERRLEIGTAAAIEVLQAKAGAATRQGEYITARTAIADAEDLLKQLLSMYDGELFSSKRIVATDRPSVVDFDWNEAEGMRTALEGRPEIKSAELEVANAKLEEKRARNDLLPQLDFNASYTQGGRSFLLRETFRGIRDKQDFRYNFGLTGSIPLGNRTARANYLNAQLQVRQAEQRLKQIRQTVMLGVRMSARGVLTSQILVESNRQARILQEANVAAEGKRLRLGVTTSYRVLEIQEDLTAAQTLEVQARIDFEKSLVDLHVAQGTLLEELNVELEIPDEELPMSFGHSISPVRVWKTLVR